VEGQAVDHVDRYALADGFNTKAGSWYEMPSLPEHLYNVSIHVFSTYNLVAAGGINQNNKCSDSLYLLDIDKSKQWRKLRATLTTPACNIGIH
jgi:lipocalin